MLIKFRIETTINSEARANELYCLLIDSYPILFRSLREKFFKYNLRKLVVLWEGNMPNVKAVRCDVLSKELEAVFSKIGIKKCRYEIFANNKIYKFEYKKERKIK